MREYQKRSTSPNLAAAQAYQRKLAAEQASSGGGGQENEPLLKINRDQMYKAYQMRQLQFFPSREVQQEKESDSASSKAQTDVAQTTDEGQGVQGKGNWRQKADTKAIFSNSSALSSGLMAKYQNLMPGVSLGHVSLHQGSKVNAALGAAGLHGLTDGENVAVASTAPAGTLEHEIGHVGQRQEQGFSLNEGSRDGYEKDADRISAKLLNNEPVERFGESVSAKKRLLPSQRLEAKAIALMQQGVSESKLSDREVPNLEQELVRAEALDIGGEETSVRNRSSIKSGKGAGHKAKDDVNLVRLREKYPSASPPPTGITDHQAVIGLNRFIELVQDVEKAYPNNSPAEIVTRIRNLYYSSASLGFLGLLPNAPNYEVVEDPYYDPTIIRTPPRTPVLREVRRGDVGDTTYNRLTSQADENAARGRPKGDNPSPYILLQNGKTVDVGHLLLTVDALLHPGSWRPYTDYNIPTIDPASWVADIGIASVWVTVHERTGKPSPQAPQNMSLSKPPKPSELDDYYKASAPESDLLGDVDGFGLFKDWNSSQSLSGVLRNYYQGTQEKPAGVNRRWSTFCRLNNFLISEDNQIRWKPRAELMNELVSRINNFCNLFAAGSKGARRTILEGWRYSQEWPYTPYMLNKFLDYLATNLSAELKN